MYLDMYSPNIKVTYKLYNAIAFQQSYNHSFSPKRGFFRMKLYLLINSVLASSRFLFHAEYWLVPRSLSDFQSITLTVMIWVSQFLCLCLCLCLSWAVKTPPAVYFSHCRWHFSCLVMKNSTREWSAFSATKTFSTPSFLASPPLLWTSPLILLLRTGFITCK